MVVPATLWRGLVCGTLVLVLAAPALAGDIEDQLSSYTGDNATGYLAPLVNAFSQSLNSGLFHTGYVAMGGGHLALEVVVTGVVFDDADRTFMATTEDPFTPEQTVEAPTVIGSGSAVFVPGAGGTSFAFPGGFDLNSFGLVLPQLRFGNIIGTQFLVRYLAFKTGGSELGDVEFFGAGFRHSISQYLGEDYPLDVALSFFWQKMDVGKNAADEDLVSAQAYTVGINASGLLTSLLEPYLGFSWDSFQMDIQYESTATGATNLIDVDFDTENTFHLTLGLNLNLAFINAFGEYSIADQQSFAFGMAFGN